MKYLIAAILVLATTFAHAEPYAILSAGVDRSGGNSHPSGSDKVYVLGLGVRANDWLRLEVDYRNLGASTGTTGKYLEDPTMVNTGTVEKPVYVCTPMPCNYQNEYASSKVTGYGLSTVLEKADASGDVAVYLRAGVFHRKTEYTSWWVAPRPNAGATANSEGLTPMYGIGFRAKFMTFEFTHYNAAYYWKGQLQSMDTASISYLAGFK